MTANSVSVVAVLTSHNRREKTVAAISSLESQTAGCELHVILVDDGSTDGTPQLVSRMHPKVRIVRGTGSLYWAGGMREGLALGMRENPDFLFWVNDDVNLRRDALAKLLRTAQCVGGDSIVVGSVCSSDGELTYGGVRRRSKRMPLRLDIVAPGPDPIQVDTMNGNVVLVPRGVYQRVGNLGDEFIHGLADWDYGLRAQRMGISTHIAPGYLGECEVGDRSSTYGDVSISLRRRLELLRSPKELPPRAWKYYVRRHAGLLWPLYWAAPILQVFRSHIGSRLRLNREASPAGQ